MRPDGPDATDRPAQQPVAIICGGGNFPGAVAEAVARRGGRPVLFGIRGWADQKLLDRYPHHWIAIGQLGRFMRLAKAEHCRDVLFIGSMLRPPITQIRLDWPTLRVLPRVLRAFRGGDDRLLSGMAELLEEGGMRLIGIKDVAPEVLMAEGALGGVRPSPRDSDDIARALQVIATLGPFDIGQAAVVADQNVLAVEAAEGTDNMLHRIAELRRQGRVTTPAGVGVLVKAPKPGQDRRFDLPAIGPQTIENVAQAGLAGVAVMAGSTMIAEPEKTAAAADAARIFFVGVCEDRAG